MARFAHITFQELVFHGNKHGNANPAWSRSSLPDVDGLLVGVGRTNGPAIPASQPGKLLGIVGNIIGRSCPPGTRVHVLDAADFLSRRELLVFIEQACAVRVAVESRSGAFRPSAYDHNVGPCPTLR